MVGRGPVGTANTHYPAVRIIMYLQVVLSTVLALSGIGAHLPQAQDSSVPRERVVGQRVASASATTPTRIGVPASSTNGVVLKELDIVVPPVKPSGTVVTPGAPLEGQTAPGVVVADRLVAPKRVESEVVNAAGFQTLGVTWPQKAEVGDLGGQVRTRSQGRWSRWVALKPSDSAPDAGTADAKRAVRAGTDPVSIGNADVVQLAFTATAKGGPAGLGLALIGSTATPASRNKVAQTVGGEATIQTVAYSTAVVQAAAAPAVITRAQWGAPAQACKPDVASSLVGAVVHHTADPNTYKTQAQAMQQIRNDAAYHINTLGWCDLGYNFVVDKWGNIYEGRANSLTQAVVGAHAGGFNTGTVGVAMLGTYDAAPSAATRQGVARIIGWRLGAYGVDPRGRMTYHTGNGGTGAKFHNQNVALPRVSGHRDVWFTACPGNGGYAALPGIRTMAYDVSYRERFTQALPLVRALYHDMLQRGADPSGLQTWAARLVSTSASAVADSLAHTQEYVQRRVVEAYGQILGRRPDPAGLVTWSREIQSGRMRVDDLRGRLIASDEYYARAGGTDRGYVGALYRDILKRGAATGDINRWANTIARSGRASAAVGVWRSLESAGLRVHETYQIYLDRRADPSGIATWGPYWQAHGEDALRSQIVGSGEYRARASRLFS